MATPHLPQKFEVAAFSAPHLAHRQTSAPPQRAQKLFLAGFSDPHFEQGISAFAPLHPKIARVCGFMQASGGRSAREIEVIWAAQPGVARVSKVSIG
jgi:hypothetical protein